MKKLKTLLTTTFKGFSGKKFNPRRYLEMADIDLEHDREGVHYRLADRVDIVALLAIERDVYNGDIHGLSRILNMKLSKMMKLFSLWLKFLVVLLVLLAHELIIMVKTHMSLIWLSLKLSKGNRLPQH